MLYLEVEKLCMELEAALEDVIEKFEWRELFRRQGHT